MNSENSEQGCWIPALDIFRMNRGQKRHHQHNEELEILHTALRKAGIAFINTHHITPMGLTKSLPLDIKGKQYDLSYMSPTGRIVILELKWLPGKTKNENEKPDSGNDKR